MSTVKTQHIVSNNNYNTQNIVFLLETHGTSTLSIVTICGIAGSILPLETIFDQLLYAIDLKPVH